MTAANWPRDAPLDERLLSIDPRNGRVRHDHVRDLPSRLRAGDLLVVNDAATLPASLGATTSRGQRIEVRLARADARDDTFDAALLGPGDWRTPTEHRPAPPALDRGETLRFDDARLTATVVAHAAISPRLVTLRFALRGAALIDAIYRLGRPVQYAYLRGSLELWHVQTGYASRPWAFEPPSAGRPLTFGLIRALQQRGIALTAVTHAAGLSSTGDPALDAALPLPERFELTQPAIDAITAAQVRDGRVVAVGTSVVRALEGCARLHDGALVAGIHETDLRIGPEFVPRIVSGLLTGLHEPTASHFALLQGFAPRDVIERGYEQAQARGYLCHEFGDSNLILPDAA